MLRMPMPTFEVDARCLVGRELAVRFLWVAALVCAIGAVASALLPLRIGDQARVLLVGAQAVMAVVGVLCARLVDRLPPRSLVLVAAWIAVAAGALVAFALHGARSLELGYFPLLVCVVALLVGTAAALVMALGCAAIVAGLALAETQGWVSGPAALAATPLSHPLMTNALLLLSGFTVGAIVLKLSNASFRRAQEREAALQRSESMLSTVFSTSPECMTLSELESGRLLTVNQAFLDLAGYGYDEVIGHTGAELGIWADASARNRLLAALREEGKVIGWRARLRRHNGETVPIRISAALCRVGDTDTIVMAGRDLSDDDRNRAELASARDAALAASRAKSAFLANTSHEIRTPMNGLLGLARLALRDGVSEAQRKAYVGHILESALNLSATLSDILDLSKIEAGKFEIVKAAFNLRDMLHAVRRGELGTAQAKGLSLELHVDAALPAMVYGDATRVRQILGNFVSNAIKFTESGGVRIEATAMREHIVRLAVSDTGIGIEADMQGRLFEPFSQIDESNTRRFGGTGLGLSISRELASLMGGIVGMNSVAGQGSLFWAELPLPAADATTAAAPAAADREDPAALHGTRVLVAEDDPVNMLITATLLEGWGVQVTQVADGEAALEAVRRAEADHAPFDAVLMDLQMPRLSGCEAARLLHERHGARTPPIIALTAAALVHERDEALRSGMCEFLTKPLDPERLRSALIAHARRIGAG